MDNRRRILTKAVSLAFGYCSTLFLLLRLATCSPDIQSSAGTQQVLMEGVSIMSSDHVESGGHVEDIIRVTRRLQQLQHNSALHLEYACTSSSLVYITVSVWTESQDNVTVFKRHFGCSPMDRLVGLSRYQVSRAHCSDVSKSTVQQGHCSPIDDDEGMKRKTVKIYLPRYIAYKPTHHNRYSVYVHSAVLKVWMVRADSTQQSFYDPVSAATTHEIPLTILPPYSRPQRPIATCDNWWHTIRIFGHYMPICQTEPEVFHAVTYPVALYGGGTGVHRTMPSYRSKVLQSLHTKALSNPRFTFVVWAYFINYCPSGYFPCSLVQHMTWDDRFATPLFFINERGQVITQLILANGVTRAFLTPTTFYFPLHTWCRLVISCHGSHLYVALHYEENGQNSLVHTFHLPPEDVQYFDDSIGSVVFGGTELNLSFQGYIGLATIYRRRALNSEDIPMPSSDHPMFKLGVRERMEQCQVYAELVERFIDRSKKLLDAVIAKKTCRKVPALEVLKFRTNTSELAQLNPPQCSAQSHVSPTDVALFQQTSHKMRMVEQLYKPVLRRWMVDGKRFSPVDIGRYLRNNATALLELSGLDKMDDVISLLQLSSCFEDHDATFMLSTVLNYGLGVKSNETEARSYLMHGAAHGNRRCLLSLGNKHSFGLDGVPTDLEQSYVYYKAIADMTKMDREEHKADDVFTEMTRLTNAHAVSQHTEESGDLFVWLKHQASQGDFSALQNMARILYWGSQGINRDINASVEYYRLAAETGDPEAVYNYGIVLIKGHGTAKNIELGIKQMELAAKHNHSRAINALGWYELEILHNYSKAVEYFHLATDLGSVDAPHNLAHMYLRGYYPGSGVDKVEAWQYISLGAQRGQLECCVLVAMYNMRGHPKISKNPALAVSWARFVGEQNPAVGRLLTNGLRTYREQEWVSSLFYYLTAADTGVEVANFNLAYLLDEHPELLKHIEKECKWRHYNLSTLRPQNVNSYALIKMADYHYDGVGGSRDLQEAANMYSSAALHGDPHGFFSLACLVEEGVHILSSTWNGLNVPTSVTNDNVSLMTHLYSRCLESPNEEAFLPCTLALYRIQILYICSRYRLLILGLSMITATVSIIAVILTRNDVSTTSMDVRQLTTST